MIIAFVLGLIIGCCIAMFVIGLCVASGRSDLEEQLYILEHKLGMGEDCYDEY